MPARQLLNGLLGLGGTGTGGVPVPGEAVGIGAVPAEDPANPSANNGVLSLGLGLGLTLHLPVSRGCVIGTRLDGRH